MITLLSLAFSTGDEFIRRVGLFGGLFFETRDDGGGATGVSMGVAEPWILAATFGVYTGLIVLTQVIYQGLKRYKQALVLQRAGG